MVITLSNKDAHASLAVMADLQETGKLGYAIARNRRKLIAELKDFEDFRDQTIQKHGIANPDGGPGSFVFETLESAQACQAELAPIEEETFTIDLMQVSEEEFYGGSLTSQQMFALDWMIKDTTDEEKG